ncbi:MAG: hypothetical protein HQK49_13255 [Oligoflexia bacterium]|nr:hypothetical protein [Oligoflexia bacterium]
MADEEVKTLVHPKFLLVFSSINYSDFVILELELERLVVIASMFFILELIEMREGIREVMIRNNFP